MRYARFALLLALVAALMAGGVRVQTTPSVEATPSTPLLAVGFESDEEIIGKGGVFGPSGSHQYVQGVVGNAVQLNAQYISFPLAGNFDPAAGAIEFYVRTNPSYVTGGYLDIGILGTSHSLGIFQNAPPGDKRIFLEYRPVSHRQVFKELPDSVFDNEWLAISAQWQCDAADNEPNQMTIFVNSQRDSSSFTRTLSACVNPSETDEIRVGWTGAYQYSGATFDELRIYDHINPNTKSPGIGPVTVEGRQLLMGGEPFVAEGVGYSPVPIGENPTTVVGRNIYCDEEILTRDAGLLHELGVNVVRVWAEPDCADGSAATAFLDAMAANEIYVVMGFGVDYTLDLANPANRNEIRNRFQGYVNRYKDHPAVLLWALGNENNFFYIKQPGKSALVSEWYTLANEMGADAYAIEGPSYHPVAIVNLGGYDDIGNVLQASDDFSLPYVDLWALNLFGTLQARFDNVTTRSLKPVLVTEYGTDAYNTQTCQEDAAQQAGFDVARWNEIVANPTIAVGGTLLNYSDEWWKGKVGTNPSPCPPPSPPPPTDDAHDLYGYSISTTIHPDGFVNEEWWGLLSASASSSGPDVLTKREAFCVMMVSFGNADVDDDCSPDVADNCPTAPNPDQRDMDGDGTGNHCDDDTDADGTPNTTDADDDADLVADVDEGPCGTDPLHDLKTPERLGNGADDDGDTEVDEAQAAVAGFDCDGDGFADDIETFVGTGHQSRCAETWYPPLSSINDESDDQWPVDINDDGRANLTDINLFFFPVRRFLVPANYDARWDLNASGNINLADFNLISTTRPAMLNGERAWTKRCVPD